MIAAGAAGVVAVTVSAWLAAAGTLSQHHFSSPKKKVAKKSQKQEHCLSAQWDTSAFFYVPSLISTEFLVSLKTRIARLEIMFPTSV